MQDRRTQQRLRQETSFSLKYAANELHENTDTKRQTKHELADFENSFKTLGGRWGDQDPNMALYHARVFGA